MAEKVRVAGLTCLCSPDLITIKHSHLINNDHIVAFCAELRDKAPYEYKRTNRSWEKEIIAHNVMFERNLFAVHSIDSDLDEHEQWWRLIGYSVIYAIYSLRRKLGWR